MDGTGQQVDMADTLTVRWTKRDLQADMPRRLGDALEASAVAQAKLLRTLLIEWVEDIEARGPAQIREAVASINERPVRAYGARNEKKPAGRKAKP
jgi:hypothetical protein